MSTTHIDNLLKQLTSDDWEKRQQAADTLAILGAEAKGALPKLRDQFLVEDDEDVQRSIIRAISQIEEDKSALVQELITYLGRSNWRIRQFAAEMLGGMGTAAKDASSALWSCLLSDDDSDVRESAATAIASVERDVKATVMGRYLDYLRDGNAKKSQAAARVINALEPTGVDATKASEALWETLSKNGDSDYTVFAFTTLFRLAPNGPAVLRNLLLDNKISDVTKSTLIFLPDVRAALEAIWSEQKAAVLDLIIKRLDDDDSEKDVVIEWVSEKASEIPDDFKTTILGILSRMFVQDGFGFKAITQLGGPAVGEQLLDDPDMPDAIVGRILLLEANDSLNARWNTDKNKVLALILAALERRDYEVRYQAAEWLKNKATEIPAAQYNRVVETLTRILNDRGPSPVIGAINAALIQLRQREREVRTSPLLDLIRKKDAKEDEKVEAIAKLVEGESREPLRALTSEWVQWIANGSKSLVEFTAEAMRSNPFAVQALVGHLLQEWQPDDDTRTEIRYELLPYQYRSLLMEIYNGARLQTARERDQLNEWVITVGQTSEPVIELKKTASLNKWSDERLAKEIIDQLVVQELAARALRVQYRIAKQLADMSDPKFFDDDAAKKTHQKIRDELKRHAVPVLGRRLPKEENVEIRESMAQALGYIGGREAIDALSRAVAGEERIRSARQELLAKYYLEPSKARSEEAANILKEAADEAKRTLRLQHRLNVATFTVGLLILTAGLLTSIFVPDTTTRIVGALAGIGGLAGLLTQMIKAPIDRVQHAMANLVQIETAFTSFIWELNLNGTYIQSQYVAEGVLTDSEISQTVDRIEEAMNLAMNLVAVYTQDRGQRIVTRLNSLLPASGAAGSSVTVIGQHLRGDSSDKKDSAGLIAINHVPINSADVSWSEREVKFKLPAVTDLAGDRTVWISLFVDGMETNSLPFHLINGNATN